MTGIASSQNTLEYYLVAAEQHNPTLQEHNNLILKSQLDKQLAEAQFAKPQIAVTANYMFTPYFNNGGQIISSNPDEKAIGYEPGLTNGGLYSALLNVSQPLLTNVFVSAYNEQAALNIRNAEFSKKTLLHGLHKDVTDAYLAVCQDQLLYQLSRAIADTVMVQVHYLEELMKRGYAKKSDLLLLKIEADNQSLAAELAKADLGRDRNALNSLCGIHDTVTEEFSMPKLTANEYSGNSNFLSRYELDSASLQTQQRVFETRYAPQLSAFFNTGLNATSLDGIQRKFGLSAGLNFSLPIYDGDQQRVNREQTDILLKTVRGYRETQLLQLDNSRKAAAERIETSRRNLEHISVQITAYEQVLSYAQEEVRAGQRSYIDYVSVIRTYLELRKNEIAARIGYQAAINQLNYWNW
jgi:outer membrane protein TolC